MKVTLGEVSETSAEGVIFKLVRYHESTSKRTGPPHCELVAVRGEKKVRMEVETVSASSLGQLLALYRRRIEGIVRDKGVPTAGEIGSVEEFIVNMHEVGMFLPPILEAAKS